MKKTRQLCFVIIILFAGNIVGNPGIGGDKDGIFAGSEIISVHLGQNVTLIGPDYSDNISVRFKRNGSDKYIYWCIDRHAIPPKRLDPSFASRVEGTKCPIKDSNVSVTLKNVTGADTGTFEWLWKNSTGTFFFTVSLNITDQGAAGVIIGIIGGIIILGIVIIVYRNSKSLVECPETQCCL